MRQSHRNRCDEIIALIDACLQHDDASASSSAPVANPAQRGGTFPTVQITGRPVRPATGR
jgi:hypothetical protein